MTKVTPRTRVIHALCAARGCPGLTQWPCVLCVPKVMPFVWDMPSERRLVLSLVFGANEASKKSSLRRDLVVDGRPQTLELKLPPGSYAGSAVAGATLPGTILAARVVTVTVEPIDCQRCIVSFTEAHARRPTLSGLSGKRNSGAGEAVTLAAAVLPARASLGSAADLERAGGRPLLPRTSAACASVGHRAPLQGDGLDAVAEDMGRGAWADRTEGSAPRSNSAEVRAPGKPRTLKELQAMYMPLEVDSALSTPPSSPGMGQSTLSSGIELGASFSPTLPTPNAPKADATPGAAAQPSSNRLERGRRQSRAGGGLLKRASLSLRSRADSIPIVKVLEGGDGVGQSAAGVGRSPSERRWARHSMQGASKQRLEELRDATLKASGGTEGRTGGQGELWTDAAEAGRRHLSLSLDCEAIQVSVVDEQPMELLYVTLDGVSFTATQGPSEEARPPAAPAPASAARHARLEQRVVLQLRSVQVDNQRYNTAHPVTLASTESTEDDEMTDGDDSCALRLVASRDVSLVGRKFAYVRLLQVHVQPISLMLDEDSMRAFISFFDIFDPADAMTARARQNGTSIPSTLFEHSMLVPVHRDLTATRNELGSEAGTWGKLFVECLDVSAIALRATLKRSPTASQGLSLNPFYALFNLITTTFITIDDAPIKLRPLRRSTFFISPHDLTAFSAKHYRAEALRAVLMIFLSLDAVGKPYESLMDLFSAAHALLVKPVLTLARRPARFPRTVLFGVLEALKSIVRVLCNMVSKMLQAWAKGIAVLTLDTKFSQRRLQHIEFRPARNAAQGLAQGLTCLQLSLLSALFGIFTQTGSGLAEGGACGALGGFLRALLGFVFKPLIGVLDFLSKACEGLKNTVSVVQEMQRRRPPRTFHVDRVLRPFSMSEARAQSILGFCKLRGDPSSSGERHGDGPLVGGAQEYYVDHFVIPWTTRDRTAGSPLLLLVTSARVVLGDEARLRPLWEVPLERIARVERKAEHVMLWTWEKVGVGIGSSVQNTHAYNIVVERAIFCNNPAVLEAMFTRLWAVAMQHDRGSVSGR